MSERGAEPRLTDRVDLEALEPGGVHRLLVALIENGAGRTVRVPVVVARGATDGPVVGVTAAAHGNELNGIFCVHELKGLRAWVRGNTAEQVARGLPCSLLSIRKGAQGLDLEPPSPEEPY